MSSRTTAFPERAADTCQWPCVDSESISEMVTLQMLREFLARGGATPSQYAQRKED